MLRLRFQLLTILLIGLTQCKTEVQPEQLAKSQQEFISYVESFTSGQISNKDVIIIRFLNPVIGIKSGTVPNEELFSFSPKIEGSAVWKTNRMIEFRPSESLPSGQRFQADFNLGKVIRVSEKLSVFPFAFQVMPQAINLAVEGAQSISKSDLRLQEIKGQIRTSDYADAENVEQGLEAKQNDKALKITWRHDSDGRTHGFTITDVVRGEQASMVNIVMDGSSLKVKDKQKATIDIAALGDFKVMNVSVQPEGKNEVDVYFSDPLNTDKNLNGLVRFKDGQNVRYEVDDNILKIYPQAYFTGETEVILEPGIENSMGYALKDQYTEPISFMSLKPAVEWLSDAVIMPGKSGLTLPFKAVNLSAINVKVLRVYENNIPQFLQSNQLAGSQNMRRVGRMIFSGEVPLTSDKAISYEQWNRFSLDLNRFFETEPGAIYRVQLSFSQKHSLYPCESDGDDTTEESMADEIDINDLNPAFYDQPNDNYYYYGSDFLVEYEYNYDYYERDNPCNKAYYINNNHAVSQNILASDIGIIAKSGDNHEIRVAVNSLISATPLAGAQVEVFNYQLQSLGKSITDQNGMLTLKLSNKPFLLVASNDGQKGYLRLDNATALSTSMFDVGGQKNKQGIKGYIYGERGVWRPGDTLFLSFILEDKQQVLPEKHPVVLEWFNPENQLIGKSVKTKGVNGFYTFKVITSPDALTGNWLAKIKVGNSEFKKAFKIEAIKPNRLKINLDFGTDVISNKNQPEGTLSANWLHGAPAKNLRGVVELTLKKGKTAFNDFDDYHFDDPAANFYEESTTIFDGQLNDEGRSKLDLKIPEQSSSPGMLIARFNTRVFETGGDASIDVKDFKYSPYASYVGVKIPKGDGWHGALYADEENTLQIATVDEAGNPIDRQKLKIEIFDIYWRYWWERDHESDLGHYISNESNYLIKTDYVNTLNGKANYTLSFDDYYWGRKLIRITDPISGHTSGAVFYLDYHGYWNQAGNSKPGGAEMLNFTLDKKNYEVGENVTINLPNAKVGRAWVSIESGSKIIDDYWVDMKAGEQQIQLKATPAMAPNAFVYITLIQPHRQTVNDLPIRLFGVQPLFVSDAKTHLDPQIEMPDELQPEQEYTVTVSEKNQRKMTYTLAVVDEGLLDLTRFKTPNAWHQFYKREALGIRTWDLYSEVMGAFSGEMAGLLAIGGDEDLKPVEPKQLNRFKPVVRFIGPFELKPGEEQTHKLMMPNYIGSVRVMVVAGEKGAYGKADKAVKVKKPLMVLATMPRVVGPGETVRLPVTLFAMDENIKKVNVEVNTNEMLMVNGPSKQKVPFEQIGEQVVYFELKVPEKLGHGKLEVIASSGNEKATYEVEIEVRVPNPRVHKVTDFMAQKGETVSFSFDPLGMAGTNEQMLEVSTTPPLNLEKRLQYLIRYPHGCIEQTTSAAFPQLFLDRFVALNAREKNDIEKNINGALKKLWKFQVNNGGFSYWPGESNSINEWGTNYAGHFMIAAQQNGYSVSTSMLSGFLNYQKQKASSWNQKELTNSSYQHMIQAYRLFTLALAGKPLLSAMNRMRENHSTNTLAYWHLAAAYHLAGQPEVADELLKKAEGEVNKKESKDYYYYTYGSELRDMAIRLFCFAISDKRAEGKELFDLLVDRLGSKNWYSTQTTAYGLLALSEFLGNESVFEPASFSYGIDGKDVEKVTFDKTVCKVDIDDASGTQKVELINKADRPLFIRLYQEGIPLVGDSTGDSNKMTFDVRYVSMNGDEIDPSRIPQGTDFIAVVDLKQTNAYVYHDMALTQIFPSGWEIRNSRFEGISSEYVREEPRYMDVRDDRVLSYFDLNRQSPKRLVVLLNAAYQGRFYLPSAYCEAMYDHSIYGKSGGQWVEVTPP